MKTNLNKLVILGKSDATITMILDNLESCNDFKHITIVNNLNLPIVDRIDNEKFTIDISNNISDFNDVFLGVYKPNIKLKVFESFDISLENFITIIHNTSSISSTSELGKGCLVNSLVSVAAHTKIGNFVSINRNCSIGHHTSIGDFSTLNPGVNCGGNVTIGEETIIGMGTTIFNGVTIGNNSIIGAGSVVTKSIPDGVVAWGNPCKIIRNNET